MYQRLRQGPVASRFILVLRTPGDPRSVAAAARSTLKQLDPDMPITGFQTMAERLRVVLLACLMSGSVPEIGVRMALGASPAGVLLLFLRRGLAMAAAGVLLGLVLSAAAARGVSSHLYAVPARNR